jgi:hypothetical protein
LRLKVFCPRLRDGSLSELRDAVKQAVSRANGASVPLVVLFGEDALRYRYDISCTDVERSILRLMEDLCRLPSSRPVFVGFSVFEQCLDDMDQPIASALELTRKLKQAKKNGSNPSIIESMRPNGHHKYAHNSAYLLDARRKQRTSKRILSTSDIRSIELFWPTPHIAHQKEVWTARGEHLRESRIDFALLGVSPELKLELRVCADAFSGPIFNDHSTITLVAARRLSDGGPDYLPSNRHAVIIHDSAPDEKKQTKSSNVWISAPEKPSQESVFLGWKPDIRHLGIEVEMLEPG